MTRPSLSRQTRRQRGVAAIEFALVLTSLLLALYGIATFATVFYTQQSMARAALDGVRAIKLAMAAGSAPSVAQDQGAIAVVNSLAASLVVPLEHSATEEARRLWILQQVGVDVAAPTPPAGPGPAPANTISVTVTYPYAQHNPFPAVPLIDASHWVPQELSSRATAALPI